MTLPGETPAVVAMLRTVVFVNPCSANSATAAARILSAVSGDECGERVDGASDFFERMFNIKRVFNHWCQGPTVSAQGQCNSARAVPFSASRAVQRAQHDSAGAARFGGPRTLLRARHVAAGPARFDWPDTIEWEMNVGFGIPATISREMTVGFSRKTNNRFPRNRAEAPAQAPGG